MQNIDGNDNVQVFGDGNTITVSRQFEVNKNSHAAAMAMESSPTVYRLLSDYVELPMFMTYFFGMVALTFYAKEYLGTFMIYGAISMAIIWYFLPMKYPFLLGTIWWNKLSRTGGESIDFRDIHEMHWKGRDVYITTFGRERYKISFFSIGGARELFDAFSIYVKLR